MLDRNMISLKRSPIILCLFFSNIIPITDMTLSVSVEVACTLRYFPYYPFKLSDVTLPATLTESVFCTQILCVIANWRLQNDLYEMDV